GDGVAQVAAEKLSEEADILLPNTPVHAEHAPVFCDQGLCSSIAASAPELDHDRVERLTGREARHEKNHCNGDKDRCDENDQPSGDIAPVTCHGVLVLKIVFSIDGDA